MLHIIKQREGIPLTTQRLLRLQPGESFCYYIGDLYADVARSRPGANDDGAPKYLALLESIRGMVANMARSGKITLEERPVTKETTIGSSRSIHLTEYIAIRK